jgi:hypothetical protein
MHEDSGRESVPGTRAPNRLEKQTAAIGSGIATGKKSNCEK